MVVRSHPDLTCFIAAEHSAERSLLRRQLEQRNVVCYSIDKTPVSDSLPTLIVQLIQQSDFVAGILSHQTSANVAYELGVASGMGKPLLLFGDRISSVPSDLASINLVKLGELDSSFWDKYLDAFLRTIQPKRQPKKAVIGNESARRWRELRSDLSKLREPGGTNTAKAFERLIERAFTRAGYPVSASPGEDYGADFAIASPDLVGTFGLPILVEVKYLPIRTVPQDTIRRLADLIKARRGAAGLVVTAGEAGASLYPEFGVPVAVVTVSELFDWLQNGEFERQFSEIVKGFWAEER
jgi:hypothetical protein